MLEYLFANKNVEKVLMYLLLHDKANATELSRIFDSSLDPIQKTLRKLEEGGLLASFLAGRVSFNGIHATPFYKKFKHLQKNRTSSSLLICRKLINHPKENNHAKQENPFKA